MHRQCPEEGKHRSPLLGFINCHHWFYKTSTHFAAKVAACLVDTLLALECGDNVPICMIQHSDSKIQQLELDSKDCAIGRWGFTVSSATLQKNW